MSGRDRAEGGEYVETTSTQAVLTAMRDADDPFVTVGDVAEVVACSRETARRKLTSLYEEGRIERREIGASAVVWWVPDEGKMADISRRHENDYYAENPDWADDLPDLGEGA
ncbi:transcriptional regulator [Halococcus sp. PRR34]|uniref:transcriptional regulator n=1 Tax=Halococcus sp. PRR34 TaxID=3020830 RepID=UPI00235E9F92|nr:transcriptional regulator [Halococcus sp. PRR34]